MLYDVKMSRKVVAEEKKQENIYASGAVQKVYPYHGTKKAFSARRPKRVDAVKKVSLEDFFMEELDNHGLFEVFASSASFSTCVKAWDIWRTADRNHMDEAFAAIRKLLL